jgi:hypothetical protein
MAERIRETVALRRADIKTTAEQAWGKAANPGSDTYKHGRIRSELRINKNKDFRNNDLAVAHFGQQTSCQLR